MVEQSKQVLIGTGVLLLAILACQPGPPPPTANSNPSPDLALTLTTVIQTLSAVPPSVAPAATEAIPTATGIPPVLTATFTGIPSPTVPLVSVTTGTNCRSGPGRVYDIIGGAPLGVKFVIIGKSTATNYWIIRLPDGRECWLWGQYAVPEGDLSALPEYAIPATPLPPVGSIAGQIKANTGSLLSNVKVIAQLSGRTFTTGNDGKYSFDSLPTGPEYITVEASDFQPEFQSVNVSKGVVTTLDFTLVGTYIPGGGLATVEGLVLMNGIPAAGANIWVWNESAQTTTNSAGRYKLDFISGRFLILAQLGNMRGGTEVSLPRDQTTIAPDIVLLPR